MRPFFAKQLDVWIITMHLIPNRFRIIQNWDQLVFIFVELNQSFLDFMPKQLFVKALDFRKVLINHRWAAVIFKEDWHNGLGCLPKVIDIAAIKHLELVDHFQKILFSLVEEGKLLAKDYWVCGKETLQHYLAQEQLLTGRNPYFAQYFVSSLLTSLVLYIPNLKLVIKLSLNFLLYFLLKLLLLAPRLQAYLADQPSPSSHWFAITLLVHQIDH